MSADPFASAVARLFDDDGTHPAGPQRGEGWRSRPADTPAPVDSRLLRPPDWATSGPTPPRPVPAPPPPSRRRLLRRPVDPIAAFDRGLNRIRNVTHPRRTRP